MSAVLCQLALVLCLAGLLAAAQTPATELPVSLERIREELAETSRPRLELDVPLEIPVARFKTRVDQRVWVLPFEEWLEKELKLTGLQRQSAEWGAQCCGMDLNVVFSSLEDALQRRRERKIREQIARELAELEAARKKAAVADQK
jgi:hypothetical protein